jgi:hypothetical protein
MRAWLTMTEDEPALSPDERRRHREVLERAWDLPNGCGLELLRAELGRAQQIGDPVLIELWAREVADLRAGWERVERVLRVLVEQAQREPGQGRWPQGN